MGIRFLISNNIIISHLSGAIDDFTKLVLANALYFKGKWESPFDSSKTKIQPFFTASKEKQTNVNMMHKDGFFHSGFVDSLDARILDLPFQVCIKLHIYCKKKSNYLINQVLCYVGW